MSQCLLDGVRTIARRSESFMSSAVFIISGLTADTCVILYFEWVIAAVIAGAIFNHIAGTGLAGLAIASALVALTAAAALLAASHAQYRDTRYRRRDPIRFSHSAFLNHLESLYATNQHSHRALLHPGANGHARLRIHTHS